MIDKAAIAAKARELTSKELLNQIIVAAALRESEEPESKAWRERSAVLSVSYDEMLSRLP